ncbi:MAG TPA: lysophospholipid acyltransferase family protein [Noviherbaspirillum sp.]|uniref:lysophospholipid acyltransferase family protein n=1 Tax=Noviherbaspirillum sp. TaxID=1926288 RepID=UPI002B45FCF0|nr:lysophospholipid acyltransferase family protein [Noviherbaspirillum sp.]HJV88132.1 lysophospholipid acyltransferase family protein [Noviherbaspirillum sp.]
MLAFRLLRVVLHLFKGLAICALVFPRIDAADKQRHVRRWSRGLLDLCRIHVEISHGRDVRDAPRALIVANHISWLDIFVINAFHPCRFVAKSDIRDWPLIGWLCEQVGTIFIARGKLREVRRIYQGLVTSLHAGEHVAFFPEGTTAPQGTLLPFHANLFEAAIEAKVPVQPYALRYLGKDGQFHPAADFVGEMTFMQSMLTVLKAGGMTVQLSLLPTIDTGMHSHRRELADAARRAIALALGPDEKVVDQIDPGF